MTARIAWSSAWQAAHLGRGPGTRGFYLDRSPAEHFATSLDDPSDIAAVIAGLLDAVDAMLGAPPRLDLVDVGAGSGSLAAAALDAIGIHRPGLAARLAVHAVDVRPRPAGLDPRVRWTEGIAPDAVREAFPEGIVGIVVAHELLDDIPVDIVAEGEDGRVHLILVDPRDGSEEPGPPLDDVAGCAALGVDAGAAADWLHRWWWPVSGRAEVGLERDRAWRGICATVRRGCAIAVDYAHDRPARSRGEVAAGTLAAYRGGRLVPAIPDGTANVTAHVALDSCADAVEADRCGAVRTHRARQSQVLATLPTAAPPDPRGDPRGYARSLAALSRSARLRDPRGAGGLTWLRHDLSLPSTLPGWPSLRG